MLAEPKSPAKSQPSEAEKANRVLALRPVAYRLIASLNSTRRDLPPIQLLNRQLSAALSPSLNLRRLSLRWDVVDENGGNGGRPPVFSSLRRLELVSVSGLPELLRAILHKAPALRLLTLSLAGLDADSISWLAPVIQGLSRLETLTLKMGSLNLWYQLLDSLPKSLRKLRILELPGMAEPPVLIAVAALPNLTHLTIDWETWLRQPPNVTDILTKQLNYLGLNATKNYEERLYLINYHHDLTNLRRIDRVRLSRRWPVHQGVPDSAGAVPAITDLHLKMQFWHELSPVQKLASFSSLRRLSIDIGAHDSFPRDGGFLFHLTNLFVLKITLKLDNNSADSPLYIRLPPALRCLSLIQPVLHCRGNLWRWHATSSAETEHSPSLQLSPSPHLNLTRLAMDGFAAFPRLVKLPSLNSLSWRVTVDERPASEHAACPLRQAYVGLELRSRTELDDFDEAAFRRAVAERRLRVRYDQPSE